MLWLAQLPCFWEHNKFKVLFGINFGLIGRLLFSRYQVMNYQQFPNGSYGYVQIATWEQGKLTISGNIQWKGENSTPPDSVCSKVCPKGYATVSFNLIDKHGEISLQKLYYYYKEFCLYFIREFSVFVILNDSGLTNKSKLIHVSTHLHILYDI